jgi:hypothetical protein
MDVSPQSGRQRCRPLRGLDARFLRLPGACAPGFILPSASRTQRPIQRRSAVLRTCTPRLYAYARFADYAKVVQASTKKMRREFYVAPRNGDSATAPFSPPSIGLGSQPSTSFRSCVQRKQVKDQSLKIRCRKVRCFTVSVLNYSHIIGGESGINLSAHNQWREVVAAETIY